MNLTLPPRGSEVVLRVNLAHVGRLGDPHVYLVAKGGAFVNASFAAPVDRQSDDGWGTIRIPALATGAWSVVAIDSPAELAVLFAGGGEGLPALARFDSRPGEIVEIEEP